ncbi:hypothetical protein WS50_27340 [Burkholderia territorii]|nr:hypothetical protein WS47_27135 [Burkholderia territorii]KUZ07302.1 hypothetical protein WS50_27340 [Burkholderia territorii]
MPVLEIGDEDFSDISGHGQLIEQLFSDGNFVLIAPVLRTSCKHRGPLNFEFGSSRERIALSY